MPNDSLEQELLFSGANLVCGVDEAGVGAWAGPLVASAVIFHPSAYNSELMKKLNDSKKLKSNRREELVPEILDCSYSVSIIFIDSWLIDAMKMKRAHRECIVRAVNTIKETLFNFKIGTIVDGEILRNRCTSYLDDKTMFVDKADSISVSVAAASIIAKVYRDKMMRQLDEEYPGYGFFANKGYGTEKHREALHTLGVTKVHRASFIPIKNVLKGYN